VATSAQCTYSAVQMAGVFNYEVLLHNTSPSPFAIYSFLFASQYDVLVTKPLLQDTVGVSSPFGWAGPTVGRDGISWWTNFQGNAVASGYIMPGQTGNFVFTSSTAPPVTLAFGCGFWDNVNGWGYGFNGTAHRADRERVPAPPPIFNPWWSIETRGGLVPPGPPPPWWQEFLAALTLAGDASMVSPQLRAGVLELALEQMSIASAAIKNEIEALRRK